jgi:hypothetical protein
VSQWCSHTAVARTSATGNPNDLYPAELYAERAGGPCEVAIVAGDHFYNGIEDEVCDVVARWLSKTLPVS